MKTYFVSYKYYSNNKAEDGFGSMFIDVKGKIKEEDLRRCVETLKEQDGDISPTILFFQEVK